MTKPSLAPAPDGATPEVSVIIPAYGVAPYIGETLASVMGQTATSWEVIVVNDGSPDTVELEAALAPFRERISYLVQPNRGAAAARNTGIACATGHWLAFLDGDDWWEPTFLERQLQFLREHDLDMAWSDGWIFGDTPDRGRRIMELCPCRGPVTVEALLTQSVAVATSATVVRRSLVDAVGRFDEAQRRAQDFDLWVRLIDAGVRGGYNTETLIHYCTRSDSLSGDALSQADRAIEVLESIGKKLTLSDSNRDLLQSRIVILKTDKLVLQGKAALVARDYSAAREWFRQAAQLSTSPKLELMRLILRLFPPLARRLYLLRSPRAAS